MLTHQDFQQVYSGSADGVLALDQKGIIVYSNPKFTDSIFPGVPHIGKPASEFIEVMEGSSSAGLLSQQGLRDAEFCLNSKNINKTILISSSNFTDSTGTLIYLSIRDITWLKKKERLNNYLNTAVEALSQARDTQSALEQISKVIVPKFANWFSIDLLTNNEIEELVLAHEDPEMISWARKYREAYPTEMSSDTGLPEVLKTGKSSFVPVVTEEMITASISNQEQLQILQKLQLHSVMIVPIINKTQIKGAITFVSSSQDYHYDESDLSFAESFASHIALALENARLNEAAEVEIAQRKEIESKLRRTELKLRSALSSGLVGTWVSDLETDKIYMDENLSRMYGVEYLPEGTTQKVLHNVIHPDDLQLIQPQDRNIIIAGRVYEAEFRVIRDGLTYWFFARGGLESHHDGKIFGGVVIDITQRKEAELAIIENEERFRFLANAIPHKLWTSEPDGRANYYNQGWYDYTGISDFQELRSTIWELIHPEDREILETEWPKAIEAGQNKSFEHRLRRSDGEYRWHLSRFSAQRDENGNITLWVGTSTDIHDQKELEQRKDEFLSIASHELKTPLTSIKAFNQILARASTDEKFSKFIDKSAEHIFRLERLISDLLDVTKINAGKLHYDFAECSITDLIIHARENFQYNSKHEITVRSMPDIKINGDRIRLEQVLDNLFANAIKYSPQADQVIVDSYIEDHSVIISVQDFGIGIEPENLHKLFDRYYRVDNTAMRFEGLGLGLYISSEILKRHKGSFWIESEVGKGSTFFIRLPLLTPKTTVEPIRTRDLYEDEHIVIRHNRQNKRLDVSWTGFQDRISIERGCMIMLDYLKEHRIHHIINDNTYVKGNWADAVEWVGNVWFPMMEKAGLKYFAHIFSPSTFSKLSAERSIDIMAGIITTQYFTDFKSAEQWIEGMVKKGENFEK